MLIRVDNKIVENFKSKIQKRKSHLPEGRDLDGENKEVNVFSQLFGGSTGCEVSSDGFMVQSWVTS